MFRRISWSWPAIPLGIRSRVGVCLFGLPWLGACDIDLSGIGDGIATAALCPDGCPSLAPVASVASVTVTPAVSTVFLGEMIQLSATLLDSVGTKLSDREGHVAIQLFRGRRRLPQGARDRRGCR